MRRDVRAFRACAYAADGWSSEGAERLGFD
jgi:hypothetical protein